jgi:hypothetical protein
MTLPGSPTRSGSMMSDLRVWGYDLDGAPITDPVRVGEVLRDPRRVLGSTEVRMPGGEVVTVSTVHLVLDHNWHGDGPPVLWETMTYTEGDAGRHWGALQWRYTSAGDALDAHAALVAAIGDGQPVPGLPRGLRPPRR